MFQKNQWAGGRPVGAPRLAQGIRMSTQTVIQRPLARTTVPRPTVYGDFFKPGIEPVNNPAAPPCEPGTPGCIL